MSTFALCVAIDYGKLFISTLRLPYVYLLIRYLLHLDLGHFFFRPNPT